MLTIPRLSPRSQTPAPIRRCLRDVVRLVSLALGLLTCADDVLAEPATEPTPVSFCKDVAPILLKRCQGCHGLHDPKAHYQLHNYAELLKPGDSGEAPVTAGEPQRSELYRLIAVADAAERMPRDADPLTTAQLGLVRRWISEGAHFDGPNEQAALAAVAPRGTQPPPPASYRVAPPITALAFRPDGTELAIGGYHEITVWNPRDGSLLRRIENVEQRTFALDYNADGSLLAVAGGAPGQSGEIALFDPAQGNLIKRLGALTDVAFGVAFDPTGARVAACGADRTIRIYDVPSGVEQRVIEDHADWVMGVAWSPDGKRLASASRDKTARVFDSGSGESVATYSGHSQTVFAVSFSADGKQVYSAGGDKRIHLWDVATGKMASTSTGINGEVFAMQLRGSRLFSGSADKIAREHHLADLKPLRSLSGHKDAIFAVSYNEPTKRLATGGFDGEVRVWNTDDGASVVVFKPAPGLAPAQPAK